MNSEVKLISNDAIHHMNTLVNSIIQIKSQMLSISSYDSFMRYREEFLKQVFNFENCFKSLIDSIVYINEKNLEYARIIKYYEGKLKSPHLIKSYSIDDYNLIDKKLNRINSVSALSFSTSYKNIPNLHGLSSVNSYSRFDDYQNSKENKYTSYKDICNLLHYNYETWKPTYSKYDVYDKKNILDKPLHLNLQNNPNPFSSTYSNNYKNLNVDEVKKEANNQDKNNDNEEAKEQNSKINDEHENKENHSNSIPNNISVQNGTVATNLDNFSISSLEIGSKNETVLSKDKNDESLNKISNKCNEDSIKVNPKLQKNEDIDNKNNNEKIDNSIKPETKIERVQKIILTAYNNQELLNHLKEKFPDFEQKITSNEVNNDFLTKVENEMSSVSFEQTPQELKQE